MWNPYETILEPLGNPLESIRKGTEALHWNPYGNYSVAMSGIHYNIYKNYRESIRIHMEVYITFFRMHVKFHGEVVRIHMEINVEIHRNMESARTRI